MLNYCLTARDAYDLGDPVMIGFRLENASNSDAWVLKWNTPLEGVRGNFLAVRCDGVEIPYRGRMVKRGPPSRDDYAHLPSGSSVQAEFDLRDAYALEPCQACRVSFGGRILDVIQDVREVPRAANQHRATNIAGSGALFRIRPGRRSENVPSRRSHGKE